jgi:tripartite ATP-independent transporter DctM subunit
MPVAFVMLVVGLLGYAYLASPEAALSLGAQTMFNTFASYPLIVVPLFAWMGFIAFHSGLSSKIYNAAYKIVGSLPAGLAMATIAGCTAFGAICGSTTATAATFTSIALPEMRKYNYETSFATATIAAAAILGVMIPPSVIFVVYGIATGESIGKLFIAGILPGIVLMAFFMAAAYLVTLRRPQTAPSGPKVSWREKVKAALTGGIEVIIIFIAVMGGLFAGIFTPTEAGGMGAFATLVVALVKRQLTWRGFVNSLADTVRLSAMILFLTGAAMIYGRFLAITGLPDALCTWATETALPPVMILVLVLIVYLILGCFIDALALVLLTVPIFYPVMTALGFDPIWFGVIIVLALGMGVLTPPVGANVYVVAGVARDIPVTLIFRGVWPYLLAIFACIALLTAFPQIALLLPSFVK